MSIIQSQQEVREGLNSAGKSVTKSLCFRVTGLVTKMVINVTLNTA
jgi:hypothetical protein